MYMADKNPYLAVVLGDFNARSNSCYTNGSTDIEGSNSNVIYPPLNEREVWRYKLANSECIQLLVMTGKKAFYNIDVNKKELLFNETILNIVSNFIPHETVTFGDREP